MGLLKCEYEEAKPFSHRGGPHDLGDPDDVGLRKIESEVLIPSIIRERSKELKCAVEVENFRNCCKEKGPVKMTWGCRSITNEMKDCLAHWFFEPAFQAECMEIYLKKRRRFRETGISDKPGQRGASK